MTKDDTGLGWNTRNELPEEIVDTVFNLDIDKISTPIQSSFGWHLILVKELKKRKEKSYDDMKLKFQNEILLEKGKEAVFDLQDDLEDLLASGNTFSEISDLLNVELIKAIKIGRNGKNIEGQVNEDFQDERILRSIFNQKLNEEGNIIDIDRDEGLAISIVDKIIEPREMTFDEAKDLANSKLKNILKMKSAEKKAQKIVDEISSGQKINNISKKYSLELKGVKPFTRAVPDNSILPIPLISKIFDSKIGEANFEKRGDSEIIVAYTADISEKVSNNNDEIKEFSKKIKEDMSLDLLAQFSEALRKKYKITINDDVIDQLN